MAAACWHGHVRVVKWLVRDVGIDANSRLSEVRRGSFVD
jgi:hypothetical protein